MDWIIIITISFSASVVGAICGIGGGVVIKPVLDASGIIPVETISFLSGCTVMSMSAVNVLRNIHSGRGRLLDLRRAGLLAGGAVSGGIIGKVLYNEVLNNVRDKQSVGGVQASVLLVITAATFLYTVNRGRIRTRELMNSFAFITVGMMLGIMSVFLGIGGGPINLVVLYYLFSMDTKQAAMYSLFIIMCSQISGLISTILQRTVPDFELSILILMTGCGILGGLTGSSINRRITSQHVDRLFSVLLLVIMGICVYNIKKYI